MLSEQDKATENPYRPPNHPSDQVNELAVATSTLWSAVVAISLPAIVVAITSPVAAFFWPDDGEIVGVGVNPLVLGSWVTLACGVGTFVASRRRASALRTFAAIFLVHIACFTVIFVSLVCATFSSM